MIRFYAPDIAATLTLPESDSQHSVRVLRMREGDSLEVVDGKGTLYTCTLVDAHPKHAAVEIEGSRDLPLFWNHWIIIAVAPTKNMDRMEWMTEKLTEMGVNRIIPLLCRHSERKEIKTERLEKIAVSAMKQSLKAWLPEISPMTPVKEVLRGFKDYRRLICYCDESTPRTYIGHTYRPDEPIIVMIGPEGDFSPEEVELAVAEGWEPVTLGDTRLRTETAAIAACQTIHTVDLLGDRQKKGPAEK